MAEKRFNTKILLKYDSLFNWNNSDLVLKAGEVAIATIPTSENTTVQSGIITPPAAVIFKVGDDQHVFSELPIVSALAADVYGWAKKSEEDFIAWLSADDGGAFLSKAEFAVAKAALDAKDKNLEELIKNLNPGEGSEVDLTNVYARLVDLETVLISFLPEGEKTADAVKKAIDAVADSVSSLTTRVEELEGAKTAMRADIAELQKEISGDGSETGIKEQIANIESSIGEVPADKTIIQLISDSKTEVTNYIDGEIAATNALINVLEPRVTANEQAIATLNGTGIGSVDYKVADAISKVVAEAPEDLNTLKEIADYIASDKTNAAEINNKLKSHDDSIAALIAKDGVLETNIGNLDAKITALTGEGFTGTLASLDAKVKANEDEIQAINNKIGEVVEGQTLVGLIANNTGAISANSQAIQSNSDLIVGLTTNINNITNSIGTVTEGSTIVGMIEAEAARAEAAEKANTKGIENVNARIDALHSVATSGMINDLAQKADEELIFDCGNASGATIE